MMLARDKMSHIGREVEDSFRHSFDRQFGEFDRQLGVFQQRINQQFGNIGNLGNGLLSPGGGGGWRGVASCQLSAGRGSQGELLSSLVLFGADEFQPLWLFLL